MDTTEIYPVEWYFPYQMAFHEYYDPVWFEKSDYEIYRQEQGDEEVRSRVFLTSKSQIFTTVSGQQFLCRA